MVLDRYEPNQIGETILHRGSRDHDAPRGLMIAGVEHCRPPGGALRECAGVGQQVKSLRLQISAALVGELGHEGGGNDDDEGTIRDVAVV